MSQLTWTIQPTEQVNLPDQVDLPDGDTLPEHDNSTESEPVLGRNLTIDVPSSSCQQPSEEEFPSVNETFPVLSDIPDQEEEESERDQTLTEQPKAVNTQDEGTQDAEAPLFRLCRQRKTPERFQYSKLGSPLLFVVNSLLQGLSDAFASSLHGFDDSDEEQETCLRLENPDSAVTMQMHRDVHTVKNGGCNPDNIMDYTDR